MNGRAIRLASLAVGVVLVVGVIASPATGKLPVVVVSLAVLAALHGYGRIIAAWARDPDAPVGLALAWGLSGYLAVAGMLIAVGVFGPPARIAIVAGGVVLHTGWLVSRADRLVAAARALRPATAIAIVLSAVVLCVLALAAAGRWSGPFADAEASYLGQLRRLDDTGALADGFGFPRASGLGGQIAVSALATPLDARASLLVDRGILLAVLVLVALAAIGEASGRAKAAVAVILPVAMTAGAEYLLGPAPYASSIVLLLATAIAVDRAIEHTSSRMMLLPVLTAAAAATISHAALVFALGVLAAGTFRTSPWLPGGSWWRRRAGAVMAAMIVPYLIAALHARIVSPRPIVGSASATSIAAGAGLGLVLAMLTMLALPGGRHRSALVAACVSVAAMGVIAPTPAGLLAYAVPIVIGVALLLALLAITSEPGPRLGATVVLVTATVGLLATARFAPGTLGWRTRAVQLIDDARSVGELPAATTTRLAASYATAQNAVPAGARLAIWVERPDLIRYDRNVVTDLRTRAVRRLSAALSHVEVEYVLVDESATGGEAWRAAIAGGEARYRDGGLVVVVLDRPRR